MLYLSSISYSYSSAGTITLLSSGWRSCSFMSRAAVRTGRAATGDMTPGAAGLTIATAGDSALIGSGRGKFVVAVSTTGVVGWTAALATVTTGAVVPPTVSNIGLALGITSTGRSFCVTGWAEGVEPSVVDATIAGGLDTGAPGTAAGFLANMPNTFEPDGFFAKGCWPTVVVPEVGPKGGLTGATACVVRGLTMVAVVFGMLAVAAVVSS